MKSEYLRIEVDGDEVVELYDDLIRLEVELDNDLASMFRMQIGLELNPDGSWAYLDDDRFEIWKPVKIRAGFEDGLEDLLSGYITHVRPNFSNALEQCSLEIWGMDASVLMDREEKINNWANKKDSDIAAEIFQQYGIEAVIEDSIVIHDEQVSTIIQRETDIAFLKRLAQRNGFECYVDGGTGYFRPPQLEAGPQPVLALQFGDQSNLRSFALEVDATTPASVSIAQLDPLNNQVLQAQANSSRQPGLGSKSYSDYLPAGIGPGQWVIGKTVTTGLQEMELLSQVVYDQAEWFVTGEGEVAANLYGSLLKPHGTVTIKGIGAAFSGVYYVRHVTHVFSEDGYTQFFTVERNGLMPTGREDFSDSE